MRSWLAKPNKIKCCWGSFNLHYSESSWTIWSALFYCSKMSHTRSFAAIVIICMCFTKTTSRPQLTRFGRSHGSLLHANFIKHMPGHRSLHSFQEMNKALLNNLKKKRQDRVSEILTLGWECIYGTPETEDVPRFGSPRRIQERREDSLCGLNETISGRTCSFFACRADRPERTLNYDMIYSYVAQVCQNILGEGVGRLGIV